MLFRSEFTSGTQVTLHPAASQYSAFTGWSSGVCSGTGDCAMTLNANTTVTAVFDMIIQGVQIEGTNYATIQDAFNTVEDGGVIKLHSTIFNEDVVLNRSVSVTLQGGFNSDFTDRSGGSEINGSITIKDGTLTVDGVTVY